MKKIIAVFVNHHSSALPKYLKRPDLAYRRAHPDQDPENKKLFKIGLLKESDPPAFCVGLVAKFDSLWHKDSKNTVRNNISIFLNGDIPDSFRIASIDIFYEIYDKLSREHSHETAIALLKKVLKLLNTIIKLEAVTEPQLEIYLTDYFKLANTHRYLANCLQHLGLPQISMSKKNKTAKAEVSECATIVKQHLNSIPHGDRTLYLSLMLLSSAIVTPPLDVRTQHFRRIIELILLGATSFGNVLLAPQNPGQFQNLTTGTPKQPSFVLPDCWYKALNLKPAAYNIVITEMMFWEKSDPNKTIAHFSALLAFAENLQQHGWLAPLGLADMSPSRHPEFDAVWPVVDTLSSNEKRIKAAVMRGQTISPATGASPQIATIREYFLLYKSIGAGPFNERLEAQFCHL